MAWVTKNFQIADVLIEVPQSLSLDQSYEEFGGVATHRMMSGAGVRQRNWVKLRTSISCEGMVPPGLHGIDWTQPQVLKCGVPRSVSSSTNAIAVPAARRSDTGYTPTGKALVNGFWVPAAVGVAGNIVTVATTSGAVAYLIEYYPQFTALLDPPKNSFSRTDSKYRWDISGEEV